MDLYHRWRVACHSHTYIRLCARSFGVPLTFTRRRELEMAPARARGRAAALERVIRDVGFEEHLTPLGTRLFGLDVPGAARLVCLEEFCVCMFIRSINAPPLDGCSHLCRRSNELVRRSSPYASAKFCDSTT